MKISIRPENFTPASQFNITAPPDVPDNVFMAMELKESTLKSVQGCIEYPKEFNEV